MPLMLFIFSIFIFSILKKNLELFLYHYYINNFNSVPIIKTDFKIFLPGEYKNSIGSFYNKSSEIILRSKDIVTNNPIYQHEMIYDR